MKVLVCGSRKWRRGPRLIMAALRRHGATSVIHGDAPGADTAAGFAGRALGLPVTPFPADWKRHGRAAGVLRNQRMLDEGKPELVLAFTDDLASSRGTRDMLERARRAGVPFIVQGGEDLASGRFRIETRQRGGEWRRIGDSDLRAAAHAIVKQQVVLGAAGRVVDLETGDVLLELAPASWRAPAVGV